MTASGTTPPAGHTPVPHSPALPVARSSHHAPAGAARATATGASVALVLASTSPRRRSLLAQAGYAFEVIAPHLDDADLAPASAASAEHWTGALAYLKARSVAARAPARTGEAPVILAADTIVVKGDAVIGQPRHEAHARDILARLSGGAHQVVTGVALIAGAARRIVVDRATVRVGTLAPDAVEAYLASGQWRGKAGAYNLIERLEAGWPIQYDGDPSTIMGLPMERLGVELARLGVAPAGGAAEARRP